MKNYNGTLFERNRYFFGKLLTAADLNAEQEYYNEKRKLINKLLFGTGVVCGMKILKVDDETIVADSGMALDSKGREIIMAEPLVCRLSDIEGFETLSEIKSANTIAAYLCVKYDEEQIEPVHSIARNALQDENDGSEYNRIKEKCVLYLSAREPEIYPNNAYETAFFNINVYNENGVKISVSAPKYVSPDEEIFLETHINKGAVKSSVELSYKVKLSFLSHEGKRNFAVRLNDGDSYWSVKLTASEGGQYNNNNGEIVIYDLRVKIGDSLKNLNNQFHEIIFIEPDSKNAMLLNEREKNLEQSLNSKKQSEIYLARIHLIMTQGYYVIDKIDNLPFKQYIITAGQSESLRLLSQSNEHLIRSNKNQTVGDKELNTDNFTEMKTGTVSVTIPEKCAKGEKYFSKQTPHFLGAGVVTIIAGLIGNEDNNETVFGQNDIFEDRMIWSIKTDKKRGLFQIGVMLKRKIPAGEYMFEWNAVKQTVSELEETPSISLCPDVYYATPHETVVFELVFNNNPEIRPESFIWSVSPSDGGRVSKNGTFTASDKAGFYRIDAKSPDGSLNAAAFVVI